MLKAEEIREIEGEIAILPQRSSACIGALKIVQRHRGWVDDTGLADVAAFLGMSVDEVDGVATFYNLIFRRPVGRHVILACNSVSCWLLGGERVRARLREVLGVEEGETTADGRFTLLTIPCLGNCDHAPAAMVDDDLHHDLTPETLEAALQRYR
jgi:NADH-quinone oxidoreductase subunit E